MRNIGLEKYRQLMFDAIERPSDMGEELQESSSGLRNGWLQQSSGWISMGRNIVFSLTVIHRYSLNSDIYAGSHCSIC